MNLLTILTVVKNNKKGIEKTIRSVLSQKKVKFKYIIIDGMSKDGTSEIISKYRNKLTHIRESDTGIYSALNKGISYSNSEYVGTLHSGDIYKNKYTLSKILKFMKAKKLDCSSFDLIYKQKNKIIRFWHLPLKNLSDKNFYKIAHPTLVIKNKILKKLKYNLSFKISGDTDFLIRLSKIKKLKYEYKSMLMQINQYGGLSTNKNYLVQKVLEDFKILKKYFPKYYLVIYLKKIFVKIKSLIKFTK